MTLVKNCGFDEDTAKTIEQAYHDLYYVSDNWVQERIEQAKIDGYVTVAFGLRLRTPLLKGAIGKLSGIQASEARTAGNALGQSWGLLNDRALNEVMRNVDKLGLTEDILPVGKVHDCGYYLIRNDVNVIKTLNDLCIKASKWQNDPVIADDDVHLSGNLDLFIPNWATPLTLPESCTEDEIIDLTDKHISELNK